MIRQPTLREGSVRGKHKEDGETARCTGIKLAVCSTALVMWQAMAYISAGIGGHGIVSDLLLMPCRHGRPSALGLLPLEGRLPRPLPGRHHGFPRSKVALLLDLVGVLMDRLS